MTKRNILALTTALIVSVFSASCTKKNETGSISDLVQHFKDSGFDGEFSPKAFALLGADDGGEYWKADTFSVEIYKFESPEKAEEISKTMNLSENNTHSNGSFTMSVSKGDEKLIQTFSNFK